MNSAEDWDTDDNGSITFSRFLNARYATVPAGVFIRIEVLVSEKPHKARGTQVALTAAECRKLGSDLISLADTWEAERSPGA